MAEGSTETLAVSRSATVDEINRRHERDIFRAELSPAMEIHSDRHELLKEIERLDAALYFLSCQQTEKRLMNRTPQRDVAEKMYIVESVACARHSARIGEPCAA